MNTKRARYKRPSSERSEVENRYFVLIGELEPSVTLPALFSLTVKTSESSAFNSGFDVVRLLPIPFTGMGSGDFHFG